MPNYRHSFRPPTVHKRPSSPELTATNPDPSHLKPGGYPRIAVIQPASFGDNVNSTLMFKPIKAKYPSSSIDVYTTTKYGAAFTNNPYITNLVRLPAATKEAAIHMLETIPDLIKDYGYDIIINAHPLINPNKWISRLHPELGENLICAWINALENYDIPYNLPIETIIQLMPTEIAKVDAFCNRIGEFKRRRLNLMEMRGHSGQTFWSADWTTSVCEKLCSFGETTLISNMHPIREIRQLIERFPSQVFFAGNLTLRECAELYNRCNRFFSVSSGLSCVCNSSWCRKDLPWVETVNSYAVSSAPLRVAGKTFWHDNNLGKFLSALNPI